VGYGFDYGNDVGSNIELPIAITDVENLDSTLSTINGNIEDLNEIRVFREVFRIISEGTTGTIEADTEASIELNRYEDYGDAIVTAVDSAGKPIPDAVYNASGEVVSVSSFDVDGDWSFSSQPVSFPVALVFVESINLQYVGNIPSGSIVSYLSDDVKNHIADTTIHHLQYVHPTGDGNSHVPANSTTNNGKVLTAGASAGTYTWEQAGSARWTALANFTATPASTSTITFGTDQTATLKVGMPVKYTISSVVYYGIITAMANNLMTIAGAPLGGDVTALSVGTPELVEQITITINGLFATATDTAALLNQLGMRLIWNKGIAHCVQFLGNDGVADTGSENRFNVYIGSTAANTICTANTNVGLDLDSTVANWVSTGIDINTAYYTVNKLDPICISITKVGNGDAQNLTVILVFVLE
jgi:hypothetical protein